MVWTLCLCQFCLVVTSAHKVTLLALTSEAGGVRVPLLLVWVPATFMFLSLSNTRMPGRSTLSFLLRDPVLGPSSWAEGIGPAWLSAGQKDGGTNYDADVSCGLWIVSGVGGSGCSGLPGGGGPLV